MHDLKVQLHPEKSRKLQRSLYLAAKKNRNRRFHALYDRMYRPDILWRAWAEVKANGGSAGIDGLTFDDIDKMGVRDFLDSIYKDLRDKNYHPKPVLRVYIPKPDGRKRPLGIPTIKDRVVQQACKIVIEPLFEANFQDNSYGFRPKRSATDAVVKVHESLYRNWWVVDADIKGYFDSIDHDILLSLLRRRISDKRVLKLLRKWLKAGVIDNGVYSPTNIGSPQGGVISPLLANIYLHVFDLYWNTNYGNLGKLIRYADDWVIICRNQSQAEQSVKVVKNFMNKLKLTLHPEKTRIVYMMKDDFDFLGFHFRKAASKTSGKLATYFWPSKKAMNKIRSTISEITNRRMFRLSEAEIVARLNKVIIGWRNYFRYGHSSLKFRQLDKYVRWKLWLFVKKRGGTRGKMKWQKFHLWYWEICGIKFFYEPGVLACRL